MLSSHLKNNIRQSLNNRKWHDLYAISRSANLKSFLDLFENDADFRIGGIGFGLLLERVDEGIRAWNELIQKDNHPIGSSLEDILKAYKDFNYLIKNLPGKNNLVNSEDGQKEDWLSCEDDEDRFNRLDFLKSYWDEKGHRLKLWAYQNFDYEFIDEEVSVIKSDFKYYQETIEFSAILEKYGENLLMRELFQKLRDKPSVDEADAMVGKIKKISPEQEVWKSRINNSRVILGDIRECLLLNSWEGDCKLAVHFGKTKDLEFFSDYHKSFDTFQNVKSRLENILKIKKIISSFPLDFDFLTSLCGKFSPSYKFPDRGKVDGLLKDHARILHLKAMINTSVPDEWGIVKIFNEIIDNRSDLPPDVIQRCELAKVRTDVFDILKNEISPRKSIAERDEIYLKNIEHLESELKGWEYPEFVTHWVMYKDAKRKRVLLEELSRTIESSDLKKGKELFGSAEKLLATNAFWLKNRAKFLSFKTEAESFEKLLLDIQSCSNSNSFYSGMEVFRDLVSFPLKYKSYKTDIEKLIAEKLKTWKIEINRFEKLSNSKVCWFIGWNWLHMDLINRIYISLHKEKYPVNPINAGLVKETQPYEYIMHQSGTLIIPNTINFQDYILTVWPGAEFFSYQDKKDWIKIIGDPIYFNWETKQKNWRKCKKP